MLDSYGMILREENSYCYYESPFVENHLYILNDHSEVFLALANLQAAF